MITEIKQNHTLQPLWGAGEGRKLNVFKLQEVKTVCAKKISEMSGLITAGSSSRTDSPFLMQNSAFKVPGCRFIKLFHSIPAALPHNGDCW